MRKEYQDLIELNKTLEWKWTITPNAIWQPDTMTKQRSYVIYGASFKKEDVSNIYRLMKNYKMRFDGEFYYVEVEKGKEVKLYKDEKRGQNKNN